MPDSNETVEDRESAVRPAEPPRPGLVFVFDGASPVTRTVPASARPIEIGRAAAGSIALDDDRMSRDHARISFEGGRFRVEDAGSRNGTFVDGERVRGNAAAEGGAVLRAGRSIFLLVADVTPFERAPVETIEGAVVGPRLRATWEAIARAGRTGDRLLITGESGSGKELAARAFHAAAKGRSGALVAVNCAAIPEGLAERLLFGAKKGAYSGADADAEGYLQAADKGTLFLDEVAELDLGVQAKLLRTLETHEVTPLGAATSRRVDVHVCAATHSAMREDVAAGRFRDDLYYRIGVPEVHLTPLRERREEVPYLISRALAQRDATLSPHTSLVEACLLRWWPGNVRELVAEVRRAGSQALARGATSVDVQDLDETAGVGFGAEARAPERSRPPPDRQVIEDTLARVEGNVSAAAKALGMHRNQIYRLVDRYGIELRKNR